jgi:Transmembrane secretion effector
MPQQYRLARPLWENRPPEGASNASPADKANVNASNHQGSCVTGRWKRPPRITAAPREKLAGAIVAGLPYVQFSPTIKAVMVRQGASIFFASGLLALLPSLAHGVSRSAIGYGILLGLFGGGAVVGAVALQPLRSRLSLEAVVSGAVATVGATMIGMGSLHSLAALFPVMIAAGTAWICFVSLISALLKTLTPDWVRARVLAIFSTCVSGQRSNRKCNLGSLGAAIWRSSGITLGRLRYHSFRQFNACLPTA